jgi:hypothetical protein
MKTFFNILQSLVGISNKRYPDDPFIISDNFENYTYFGEKGHIIFLINNIFYKAKDSKKTNLFSKNASAKFLSLNCILENNFYKNELKERIFDIFTRAQKHYHAFSRLGHIYKLKKNPYVVTNDLMLNPIDSNNKLTFILVEKKSNFLFNINEIINIIETAIGHAPNFFSEPLSPLNPYNNQELTHATLYNIYFQMKQIGRVTPLLFHCFFLENFNKNNFVDEHEPIIREYSIKKYVFNSPHTSLYNSVIAMLRNNRYTNKLIIHKNFPKDLLVDIFRPFLFHDYIANYYVEGTPKAYKSKKLLYIKLRKFYEFNPSFGREIIKLIKKNNRVIKQEAVINSKHISFYDIIVSSKIETNELVFLTHNSTINILINNTIFNAINNNSDETTVIDDEDDDDSYSDIVNATTIYDHNYHTEEEKEEEEEEVEEEEYEDQDSIS